MWDYLFAQIPTIPLSNKESPPVSSSSHLEDMLYRDRDPLHCIEAHALCEAGLQPVTPLHRVGDGTPYVEQEHCSQILESQLALSGPFTAPSASGRALRPGGIEHHPHTRLSKGHGSDTICKDLGHHPKRLAF